MNQLVLFHSAAWFQLIPGMKKAKKLRKTNEDVDTVNALWHHASGKFTQYVTWACQFTASPTFPFLRWLLIHLWRRAGRDRSLARGVLQTLHAQKRSRSRQTPKKSFNYDKEATLKCCLWRTTYQTRSVSNVETHREQLGIGVTRGVDLLLSSGGIDDPCGLRLLSDPAAISSWK